MKDHEVVLEEREGGECEQSGLWWRPQLLAKAPTVAPSASKSW